jgi:hypothetical protein
MHRLVRPIVTIPLLAAFGTISLLGHGLHLLPGACDHHAEIVFAASHGCAHHDEQDHAGIDSGHEPAAGRAHGGVRAVRDSSECPICQFLAKGKVLSRSAPSIPGPVAVGDGASTACQFVPLPLAEAYHARAPPLG